VPHKIVYELDGQEVDVLLSGDELVIGRDGDNDVVIRRPSISRRHARFYRTTDGWRVADLGSLNGTRVNDVEREDVPLRHGDRILLHDFRMTFIDQEAPSVSLVPAPSSGPAVNSHTVFQEVVDFAQLATGGSDVRHLQTLLTVVTRASEALLASPSLDDTFARVLDLVFDHLPVQRGMIMLWDEEREDLRPWCVKHRTGSEEREIRFSRTIANKVFHEKIAVLTTDAQCDERFASGESVFELDIHAAMAAPLSTGDRADGLIYADAVRAEAFDKFDLDLLSAIGNQLAVAVQRAKLEESVVRQRVQRRRLERYHSPAVVERITQGGAEAEQALMAEERDVTVLFADVVGFTKRCEAMEPREIADLLNRYFSEMAEMIFRHEGTLDKFIGDCLMAVFGAPLVAADHARRAAEAALGMRQALLHLNEVMPEESRLEFRVGLHSGRVVAGDIGSVRRSDYTVLGSTVNLASRLESEVARPGQIVISEVVQEAIGDDYLTRFAGEHQPKGTSTSLRCFELVGRRRRIEDA
jgi:adenylate cyclase